MGCCVSRTRGSKSAMEGKTENRAPGLEEERVKEVLSETPSKLQVVVDDDDIGGDVDNSDFVHHKKINQNSVLQKIKEEESGFGIDSKKPFLTSEEHGEESEDVSVSESVSTITVTDSRREDDGDEEVRQTHTAAAMRRRLRSPAKLPPSSPTQGRNRSVANSPSRRSDQSPRKRTGGGYSGGGGGGGSVRLVQGRDGRQSMGMSNHGSRSDPRKRDPGESSGRRSMSPATNRSTMGRSPSGKITNRSPGRVRSDPSKSYGKRNGEGSNNGGNKNELLENPLVSLECFIFL